MPDREFRSLIKRAEKNRYEGWRNWRGRWRLVLKLDNTHGMNVLDYGSGIGIEALQYARSGNIVSLADIVKDNLKVAKRTLGIDGYACANEFLIKKDTLILPKHKYDIIHCCGVLHHIREPEVIVRDWAKYVLVPNGELRLMVYTDKAWTISTKTEPPEIVEGHPKALSFARTWDEVGSYADWYDADRLEKRFGKWFSLEEYEPLTVNGVYAGAIMRRK